MQLRGMAMRGMVLALAIVSASSPTIAERIRGTVYSDDDSDGVRDPGEAGIPDVSVSNGREVVRTDADGTYHLPVEGDTVLFVTKPSGYAVPVDADMLPRFFHVHQPEGSPDGLRYAGLAPTGPLPETLDFPLRAVDEPRAFEAILFADTQPQTEAELDYIRDDVVSELIGTSARFGMTVGDIMYDDLSLLPRYNRIIARIGIPWYNVPGNHELNFLAADDRHSLDTFKRFFGPTYYSFEYGDAHFVVLDNIEYSGRSDDPNSYRGNGSYRAHIADVQLEWLRNDLAHVPADRLVFLAMHAPLRTYTGEPEHPSANTDNRRELFELLAGREHLYAVAGHTHTTEHHYFGEEDGFPGPGAFHHHVLTTVSGSWWSGPLDERGIPVSTQRDGTPNGYHVLEVDGVEMAVRYKAAGAPADHQMRITFDSAHHHHRPEALRGSRPGELIDGRISHDALAATRVIVNLFDGGPRSSVSLAVGDRPAVPMQRSRLPDPHAHELFVRHPDLLKPWVKAVPSGHLWVAELPDGLSPGVYTVTATARDEFGRTHHAHRVLEIEGASTDGWPGWSYP